MEVNVTLVLQALQFACVYYCLYRFLFTPACPILDEQEQLKQDLYKNLEYEQQVKDALLQDYRVKNDAFKSTLLDDIPEQATQLGYQESTFHSVLPSQQENQLSQQDKQEIEEFLVENLSKVIKHD